MQCAFGMLQGSDQALSYTNTTLRNSVYTLQWRAESCHTHTNNTNANTVCAHLSCLQLHIPQRSNQITGAALSGCHHALQPDSRPSRSNSSTTEVHIPSVHIMNFAVVPGSSEPTGTGHTGVLCYVCTKVLCYVCNQTAAQMSRHLAC